MLYIDQVVVGGFGVLLGEQASVESRLTIVVGAKVGVFMYPMLYAKSKYHFQGIGTYVIFGNAIGA